MVCECEYVICGVTSAAKSGKEVDGDSIVIIIY